MAKTVKANGKTFTFNDNVSTQEISNALDEYFRANKPKEQSQTQTTAATIVEPKQNVVTTEPKKNPFEPTMSVNKIDENITSGISGTPTQAPYYSKTTQRLKEIESKKANIDNLANEELLKKEYINW